MRSRWCGSAFVPPTIRAFSIPSRRSTALLRRELPAGSYWYRYNDDGYGEHADGAPFDGAGIGRLWPLLTGERAHYELAAGRPRGSAAPARGAGSLRQHRRPVAGADLGQRGYPARELFLGRPSGSAMPLVWAHAEHIKLLRSIRDNAIFDMPPQTLNRYVNNKPAAGADRLADRVESRPHRRRAGSCGWNFWMRRGSIGRRTTGKRFPTDDAIATGLGTYILDLPTERLTDESHRSLHHVLARPESLGRSRLPGRDRPDALNAQPPDLNRMDTSMSGPREISGCCWRMSMARW